MFGGEGGVERMWWRGDMIYFIAWVIKVKGHKERSNSPAICDLSRFMGGIPLIQ